MRRSSIARLMVAVGLSGLALVLLRGWLGTANRFGFLGLFGFVVLVAGVAWLVTAGILRRFFAGFGLAGLAFWVVVLVAPTTVLDCCSGKLILPIRRWTEPEPQVGLSRLELMFLEAELRYDLHAALPHGSRYDQGDRAHLFHGYRELQVWLLIPMAALATVAGLITAARRSRRTNPPTSVD